MLLPLFILLLLHLCRRIAALPTEQKPLNSIDSKGILDIRAALRKAEIIPTVINDFIPSHSVSISWDKKSAALGNTLKPKHVQDQPTIKLHDETNPDGCYSTNMTYVITLTDPDAPSRDNPKWSEFCHWIVSGVHLSGPSDTVSESCSNSGGKKESDLKEVMEYKPPGPPPKTGKHRYVFLVFAPSNSTSLPLTLSKPKDRKHWGYDGERKGVRKWAEENGLVPVGANFIYAQNDEQ
ncbi:PEBP-like protein [Delitschia confertaspora ATCC 74209]|uniref:PEBP-like protein n=1 Tax=Delitschia confertaspora ATCC 74209 TaxID=1513339 RepID=A0A9P4MP34_9PLEO|nr:PEBP-like protein [Delitschia confertaspora ATCC 74209]